MKCTIVSLILIGLIITIAGCGLNPMEKQMQSFIESHLQKIKSLEKEMNLSYWDAATTGKQEDYDKYGELQLQYRKIYSNTGDFEKIKEFKESGQIKDLALARQLELLYNGYLKNQIEPELLKQIVELGTQVEKKFSVFRGEIDGKKVSTNEINEILKKETDSSKRKKAWLASKQVGEEVAADLIKLVKLRNQAARKLGFENYYVMSLTTAEQSVEELDKIFTELRQLTNEPFDKIKAKLDSILSDIYGIGVEGIMPWHYHDPFFQEGPLVYEVDFDQYYSEKDVNELAAAFYKSIGMPVESILKVSDLYEREGKNPHAFMTDIDREGDVRVLCNLLNTERWMETMLHELGHGIYEKYMDFDAPFLLRGPAHIFTTEAVAMFFGRLSRNGAWMQQMLDLTDEQRTEIEKAAFKSQRLKQLVFARWCQVMFNFERQLYANPDQDLNNLWWDMVEEYQYVTRPTGRDKPDWAAKIHFSSSPVYYHNYMMGELMASQVHHYLVHNVLSLDSDADVSYVGRKKVGDFFRKKIFEPGDRYYWNEMIERATGEPLTPKYFVEQFVKF